MSNSAASAAVQRTLRGIPKLRQAEFSYKPQCESCVANTFCMGCSFPACTYCYESRCDTKRDGSKQKSDCFCGVRCKSRIALDTWLTTSQGLYPGGLDLAHYKPQALPSAIPIIKAWGGNITRHMYKTPRTFIIPINAFLSKKNTVHDSVKTLRTFFPPGSQLILSFCVEDSWIERIWNPLGGEKARLKFWQSEWLNQFDYIMGVNYSVYWNDPQMEIHYAIRRTMFTLQEIDDAKHKTLPLAIWYTDKEVWPQLDAYAKNGVNTVVLNMQFVAGAQIASYRHDLAVLDKISRAYPFMRFLCYGVSSANVIHEARNILGPERLIVATGNPYIDTVRAPIPWEQKTFKFQDHLHRLERLVREGKNPMLDSIGDQIFTPEELAAVDPKARWDGKTLLEDHAPAP